jgi:hypothetical protein
LHYRRGEIGPVNKGNRTQKPYKTSHYSLWHIISARNTDGRYLEPEGFEKTYRYQQQSIVQEVDLLSSRKPFDMILPGKDVHLF